MKIFRCDHCGKEDQAVEGEDHARNWDKVIVSNTFHFHICENCMVILFEWLGEFKRTSRNSFGERPQSTDAQTQSGVAKE